MLQSPNADVVELVDTQDLKSWDPQGSCEFDSRRPHHHKLLETLDIMYFTRFGTTGQAGPTESGLTKG
jgi:hypothetical protein